MINPSWNFIEAVDNIEAVKDYYIGLLSSFSIYETRQKKITIQTIRGAVYELEILEWQKDRIWEYLNGDENISTLKNIANRQK